VDPPLRIAQIVPPIERVPREGYGGTERVVFELVSELVRRGHEVTTFASGDSEVPGRLVPTEPRALRPAGHGGDISGFMISTVLQAIARPTAKQVVFRRRSEASRRSTQRAVKARPQAGATEAA